MIKDMPAHWARLTREANRVMAQATELKNGWSLEAPCSPEEVQDHEGLVLDLRDEVNHLWSELLFLRGHQEGLTQHLEVVKEDPNDRGDRLIDITPGTAPCSEIAQSFGVSTARVVALARSLKLDAVGVVTWELANGSIVSARSYNLAQWKAMRNRLVDQGDLWSNKAAGLMAPARIYPDSEEA